MAEQLNDRLSHVLNSVSVVKELSVGQSTFDGAQSFFRWRYMADAIADNFFTASELISFTVSWFRNLFEILQTFKFEAVSLNFFIDDFHTFLIFDDWEQTVC